MKAVLYMVIPCYNEEEVLPVTSGLFLEELQLLIEKFVEEKPEAAASLLRNWLNEEWE